MVLKKLKTILMEEGLIELLRKVFWRVSPITYSVKESYLLNLTKYSREDSHNRSSANYSMRPLTLDILSKMKNEYPNEVSNIVYQKIRKRIESCPNVEGYVVVDMQSNICGYAFFASPFAVNENNKKGYLVRSLKNDLNGHFHLRNNLDTALSMDAYTFEAYRGKGVQTYAILQRIELASKNKYRYLMANVAKENIVSRRNLTKLGFKKTHVYRNFRIFKHTFYYTRKDAILNGEPEN